MDGRKSTVKQSSLQKRLNRWIIIASGIFSLLAGIVSGITAFIEAQESQDSYLQQIGTLLINGKISTGIATDSSDADKTLIIQCLQISCKKKLPISSDHADGIYTFTLKGEQWRTLILTFPHAKSPLLRFAIAQQTEFRDDSASYSSLLSFFSVLLLAPLLMGLIHFIIRYEFKPLQALSIQIDQRTENDITSLSEQNVPTEIVPFIVSINQLLRRINLVLNQQRRFVSDAAHELRTPLTALSLLTENLTQAKDMVQVRQRMIPLQKGMHRMNMLVNQLLGLARMQGRSPSRPQAVNVRQIAQEVIADLYPLAEAKAIDLGMVEQANIMLMDTECGLATLLKNAIDNAIRYSPEGGQVDVSLLVRAGQGILQVRDNGPGIPENELDKICAPFYRASNNRESGNGLGLAICLEIAKRSGGDMILKNHPQGGLLFTYRQNLPHITS